MSQFGDAQGHHILELRAEERRQHEKWRQDELERMKDPEYARQRRQEERREKINNIVFDYIEKVILTYIVIIFCVGFYVTTKWTFSPIIAWIF